MILTSFKHIHFILISEQHLAQSEFQNNYVQMHSTALPAYDNCLHMQKWPSSNNVHALSICNHSVQSTPVLSILFNQPSYLVQKTSQRSLIMFYFNLCNLLLNYHSRKIMQNRGKTPCIFNLALTIKAGDLSTSQLHTLYTSPLKRKPFSIP
jgi:hypothetical protein